MTEPEQEQCPLCGGTGQSPARSGNAPVVHFLSPVSPTGQGNSLCGLLWHNSDASRFSTHSAVVTCRMCVRGYPRLRREGLL